MLFCSKLPCQKEGETEIINTVSSMPRIIKKAIFFKLPWAVNLFKFSLYSVHEIKILVPTFFCGSEMAEKSAKILLFSLVSRPGSKEH